MLESQFQDLIKNKGLGERNCDRMRWEEKEHSNEKPNLKGQLQEHVLTIRKFKFKNVELQRALTHK